ncbi:uncharacterized protein LOC143297187 [Babylonia areolata]|uniref:uncharacterized protein LOC143297187 n=1 Tax=Babylonia areolata TaxID=304850 RepID=UPI003FD468E3
MQKHNTQYQTSHRNIQVTETQHRHSIRHLTGTCRLQKHNTDTVSDISQEHTGYRNTTQTQYQTSHRNIQVTETRHRHSIRHLTGTYRLQKHNTDTVSDISQEHTGCRNTTQYQTFHRNKQDTETQHRHSIRHFTGTYRIQKHRHSIRHFTGTYRIQKHNTVSDISQEHTGYRNTAQTQYQTSHRNIQVTETQHRHSIRHFTGTYRIQKHNRVSDISQEHTGYRNTTQTQYQTFHRNIQDTETQQRHSIRHLTGTYRLQKHNTVSDISQEHTGLRNTTEYQTSHRNKQDTETQHRHSIRHLTGT